MFRGLEDIISTLDMIAKKTGVIVTEDSNKPQSIEEEIKDPFIRSRKLIYDRLTDVLELIKQRKDVLKKRGNCDEAIKKNVQIHDCLTFLDQGYAKLLEIYMKQKKQLRKFSTMELQSRYESITELRTHIDDAKNMHRTNHAAADKIKTIHDLIGEQTRAGNHVYMNQQQRELMDNEKEALQRFGEAKKRHDQAYDKIGKRVEELGYKAGGINLQIAEQGEVIQQATHATAENEEELTRLDVKLKAVMRKQKNATFFCRVILVIAFIALAGVLIKLIF